MVSLLRKLMIVPLLLLAGLATAQQVDIEVDRNELARGETLTLTIRVYEQRQGVQLDLTPLTDNFDVLGTRTSSQIRSVNGSVESWTDYVVTLFPLTEGELEIPSLNINSVQTDPIAINVVNQGPRSNQASDELFLEIEVNKESVYVQEQLLFTVRLFYTINGIRNPQFTEPEMPDTVVELIGSPNQYEELIDGVRYGVYEKRYVIFPQRSGPLEIPDILFRGEVTDGSSNFVFRNLNTRRVTAFIDGITIDVKERPASAQSVNWLPASRVSLSEDWSRSLDDLQIGDSVVRTITMSAEGLDGAVLPPLTEENIAGMNTYPDPPEIDRSFVDGSIVGTRIESTTLVATAAGELEIPQVTVPWWNVDSDQMESSIIPATRINIASVAGEVPSEQAVASTENLEDLLARAPVVDQAMIDAQAEAEVIQVDASWMNYLIAAAFAIVLFSIYRLAIVPRSEEISAWYTGLKRSVTEHYDPANNETVAYRNLQAACRSGDEIRIRNSLITWCGHLIRDRKVRSMEDILQQGQITALHEPASALQDKLFNQQSSVRFSASELLDTVNGLRKTNKLRQRQQARDDRFDLPPLYKS
ncbi:MAG: BatD family protein [Pseudomonadales bacterium]|nr:BatD family protein [Pseudomonadales bacterium]